MEHLRVYIDSQCCYECNSDSYHAGIHASDPRPDVQRYLRKAMDPRRYLDPIIVYVAVGTGVSLVDAELSAALLRWGLATATSFCINDGDCTNEAKAALDAYLKLRNVGYDPSLSPGITVLGRYPKYINVAGDVGGRIFDIPPDAFDRLSRTEQWALNQQFLDGAIKRGDIFYLANKWKEAEIGSFFRMELEYLFSKGYTLSIYQNYLIPPHP